MMDDHHVAEAVTTTNNESAIEEPPTLPALPYRVAPGTRVRLDEINPDDIGNIATKKKAKKELKKLVGQITSLQERLYAENRQSLLVVLQAIDTGGKDGAVRGVFSGVNPEGVQVWSFKAPSVEELEHDFLWRIHQRTPARRMITVFNRSHYEDVLVARVKHLAPEAVWQKRFATINDFERMLAENGTTILKFYLHISRDEQKRRLQSRLDDPDKHWKFELADITERGYWDDYTVAFEDAISRCSTDHAPWFVIPANAKWFRNVAIARTVVRTLEAMNPQFPQNPQNLDGIVIPD
ncbi:MAG TPA: polyphosphate kinase [Chloroflexi bacterium]|jgi:PPK2 family polyphosphate:nucleotide phosphotransferase|nr:polyphosphate kinase [Chloroflexota bacterium]HCG30081.1 polyphosphate kinase [Chloroflexota bacterium]